MESITSTMQSITSTMHAPRRFLLCCLLACLGLQALGSEIINGGQAPEKEFLYMASVQVNGSHACGGFLIDQSFVVTAAHCGEPTGVVLGTHNLQEQMVKKVNRYDIKLRCRHPSYENVAKGDDIMLLKLSRKARLDKRLNLIQLPKAEMKIKDKCTVAGWGFTKTGGAVVDRLNVVDVPVVNREDCRKRWAKIQQNLPANVICAGGYPTKEGFCQGDSGGPLVCNGRAVGVVSYNMENNCDYPNVPNVYTNISKYLPWIKKILKKKNCTN
ncbi:mast cell protease 1A-like [Pungitius pungitius]|uniref:mast cell protease 1A-like n=1 Tax=Pungitius pungitius TaxID=134920 RepID=UPI002E10830D